MSRDEREGELESLLRDGLSRARREDFRTGARATRAWEERHPTDLAEALDWIDALRELFGDPKVDHRVVRGGDYRL